MTRLAFTGVAVGGGAVRSVSAGSAVCRRGGVSVGAAAATVGRSGCACARDCVGRTQRGGCTAPCCQRKFGRRGAVVTRMAASDSSELEKQIEMLEKALKEQDAKLERLETIKEQEYASKMVLADESTLIGGATDPRMEELFKQNREWAASVLEKDPEFFNKLKDGQSPEILWIGCSDSRVPANQILNMMPGEVFVHRNIGNCVIHTDLNCLSVMEYSIKYLKVNRLIVCGHYNCGAVKAAMTDMKFGVIDNWLRHIRDVRRAHAKELAAIEDEDKRYRRLCELHLMEQFQNVCSTTIVQNAWDEGHDLTVHALIFDTADGSLKDFGMAAADPSSVSTIYRVPQSA